MRARRATILLGLVSWVVACIPPPDPLPPGSRCYIENLDLVCPHETVTLDVGSERRQVHWQVPAGTPPAAGWPTVVLFQGSLVTAELTWFASKATPFGGYYQTQTVQHLLDAGYAVLTPESHLNGATFWDTNNPFVPDYYASNDHALILMMLEQIESGFYGALDAGRLYAGGISSGGHMTSRMAVSYPGRFRALAIQSGSYATCLGWLCAVGPIPPDHPPTLFLHGALDPVVPLFTMEPYADALAASGIPVRKVIDPVALHAWIPAAPGEVLAWFDQHR